MKTLLKNKIFIRLNKLILFIFFCISANVFSSNLYAKIESLNNDNNSALIENDFSKTYDKSYTFYKNKDYKNALKEYELIAQTQANADNFYNLAVLANLANDKAKAVIYAQMALAENFNMEKTKILLAKIAPQTNFFYPPKYVAFLPYNAWILFAVISFWLAILILIARRYFFIKNQVLNFFFVIFILNICYSLFAIFEYLDFVNQAISIKENTFLRISPAKNSKSVKVLDIAKPMIVKSSYKDFYKVKLSPSKEENALWVLKEDVEKIYR